MWILAVFGFVLVVGTLLGVAWRFVEDYLEKRATLRQAQLELEMEEELTQGLEETGASTPAVAVKTN